MVFPSSPARNDGERGSTSQASKRLGQALRKGKSNILSAMAKQRQIMRIYVQEEEKEHSIRHQGVHKGALEHEIHWKRQTLENLRRILEKKGLEKELGTMESLTVDRDLRSVSSKPLTVAQHQRKPPFTRNLSSPGSAV
ncbi:unnamed protein product [Discosporangium mesarthrocarpum]